MIFILVVPILDIARAEEHALVLEEPEEVAAFIEWVNDFIEDFDNAGIDIAVANALENNIQPNDILTFIISNNDKFELRISLKALYCAGADRDIVLEAANKLGITIEKVSKAFEEALAECASKLALSDREIIIQSSFSFPLLKPEPISTLEASLSKNISSSKHRVASTAPLIYVSPHAPIVDDDISDIIIEPSSSSPNVSSPSIP
ncbi:MAG: hypothetical protein D3923_06375 [Candidatus Electrothrix sp. AR3]|nr:hypothetical protein [Candidatus Electrothrix sp. AR3]